MMRDEGRIPQLFCVRAGEGGKYADAFLHGEYVAIRDGVRDLHTVRSYDELRLRVREAWPKEPLERTHSDLGRFSSFILKIQIGDFILTPSRDRNLLYIGEVISYPFKVLNVDKSCPYSYRRKVEWPTEVQRWELPKDVQSSLRSHRSVFQVKGDASWIEKNVRAPFPPERKDERVGVPMPRLVQVEPRDGYRIWVRYDDGLSGEVDLSDIPRDGVFATWNDRTFFESVHLDEFGGAVWGEDEEVDACADYLYMRLTGKTPEELMPGLRRLATTNA